MNKNKSILIPLFIIILLFSFNSRVEAAKEYEYKILYKTYYNVKINNKANIKMYSWERIIQSICISGGETTNGNAISDVECKVYGGSLDPNETGLSINATVNPPSSDEYNNSNLFKYMKIKIPGNAYSTVQKNLKEASLCNDENLKGKTISTICTAVVDTGNGENGICQISVPLLDMDGKKNNDSVQLDFTTDENKNITQVNVNQGNKGTFNKENDSGDKITLQDYNNIFKKLDISLKIKNKNNKEIWDLVKITDNKCAQKYPICYLYSKKNKRAYYYIESDASKCNDNSKYSGLLTNAVEGNTYGEVEYGTDTLVKPYRTTDFFTNFSLLGNEKEALDCENLFENSEDLKNMIKLIINIIRIAVPIILIVFGVIDFGKAVFSSSEDTMKKAQGAFIKRIIIAVCILLVPTILKILLTIANQIWPSISADFCGIL